MNKRVRGERRKRRNREKKERRKVHKRQIEGEKDVNEDVESAREKTGRSTLKVNLKSLFKLTLKNQCGGDKKIERRKHETERAKILEERLHKRK